MKVENIDGVPIKSWCNDPEEGALEQARNLAKLPFLWKHVALMPDTHEGYGMPIGGVICLDGAVIPNAVGVDIGCGMCAMKTRHLVKDLKKEELQDIVNAIKERIPVGFKHQANDQDLMCTKFGTNIIQQEIESAKKQMGTLGGGNHFIELQKDEEGYLWIMIHSGSRNVGKKVADHYNKIAKELNQKWHSAVPEDLYFLPTDSEEGKAYLQDMEWCLEFAFQNRLHMMETIIDILEKRIPGFRCDDIINIHHNYANLERHYGKDVWVHRKGATLAEKGTIGIIPGSQGTKSYIVQGLGNRDSFNSCSHGAGRKMGRKQAIRELSLEGEKERMDQLGILHSITTTNDLDEAPGAYKDIDIVMEEQKDLVSILVELTPIAVIKG